MQRVSIKIKPTLINEGFVSKLSMYRYSNSCISGRAEEVEWDEAGIWSHTAKVIKEAYYQ